MGQRRIAIQLVVKEDELRQGQNRIESFLTDWFHEDRRSAPPFEMGSLLWWGYTDMEDVNQDLLSDIERASHGYKTQDTTNITRSRERSYGFGVTRNLYHIFNSDPQAFDHDTDDEFDWMARCGAPIIEFAYIGDTPYYNEICVQCWVRNESRIPEHMKMCLPKNWEVWSENPHGTNWRMIGAKDQGEQANKLDRYVASYESVEGFRADYFYVDGSWGLGAN